MAVDKFDKRLLNRKVRKGDMSHEERMAYLEQLPDVADNLDIVLAKVGVGEDEPEGGEEVAADGEEVAADGEADETVEAVEEAEA